MFVDLEFLDFFCILLFFFLNALIASILFFFSLSLHARLLPNLEKMGAYECGFDSFSDSWDVFDVKFYFVAILFIIFDLEIIYIFPWLSAFFGFSSLFLYYSFFVFLLVLAIGFLYECVSSALDW